MKIDLSDITFLIAVRIDTVQRLENLLTTVGQLEKQLNTHIYVLEANDVNNQVLSKCLSRKINYCFVEDNDPVFYRTKYFNRMAASVDTPFIALWDADVIVEKNALSEGIASLRAAEYDVVYPYNTQFYEVPEVLRKLFIKKPDIRLLTDRIKQMRLLYNCAMVGGAVLLNKEKYVQAGLENENHYGWGNDDWDRYYRFLQLGYRIRHTGNVLFHLTHPRNANSRFRSRTQENRSKDELLTIKSFSPQELRERLDRIPYAEKVIE